MQIFGDILPFFGFASRFITMDGQCLYSEDDAIEEILNNQPVIQLQVFELSWFGYYWWIARRTHGFLITGIAEIEINSQEG